MAFAVRGRALWLPPLLLFASVLLIGSLAFAIANLDRGQEALPPPFPTPGGGDTPVPSSEAGLQLHPARGIPLAPIFLPGFLAGAVPRAAQSSTPSLWEALRERFGGVA